MTDARTPSPMKIGAVRSATSTGALTTSCFCFAATKSGDSSTFRRMTRPTATRIAETRNGMRHPHEMNCSSGSRPTRRNISVARMDPAGDPCCTHAPARPFFSGRAFSVESSTAPPHSPPTAKPCRPRSTTSRIGASIPICANVGSRPIRVVATPIKTRVMTRTFLRPSLSPKCPKTRPPTGRMRKPTQKVVKDASSAAPGATSG